MADKTQYKDHRGVDILSGDKCMMDGGHSEDTYGHIIQDLNGLFWFEDLWDGDQVPLDKVHYQLEVVPA